MINYKLQFDLLKPKTLPKVYLRFKDQQMGFIGELLLMVPNLAVLRSFMLLVQLHLWAYIGSEA